ncbi:MAG: HAD-IA family hydrolase [Pleurocapsa sp. SU_196_0]|nr:HAD-IA family hydrolase [Pleurocapsa sp. SU_196_0]
MALRALIFDFDGTMLDTETPEFTSWQGIYRDHGQELEIADWGRGIGTWGAFDPWHDLESRIGTKLEQERIALTHHERVRSAIAASSLMPGVHELLHAAKAAGLKLAIASSSSREWVHGWAQTLGVLEFFDATATKDDVLRVKPDPALFTLALEKLQVTANEALALEDSPNGSKAALGAGMRCVVIPNEVTKTLEFPEGVHRINTLQGVILEDWRALW